MTTTTAPTADGRPVPALGKTRLARLPAVAERVLDNGLRVLAVRRAGVPLTEVRMRLPFDARNVEHVARAQLLSDTLLSGTDLRSAHQLAADLQALGGQLSASTDADRLALGGSVLTSGLPGLLALLSEVLTCAAYPDREVEGERDRLVQELAIYRSQAGVVAREALLSRLYGDHPYGRDLPTAEQVQRVTARQLRSLHGKRVAPRGAVLVLVGDLPPARALAMVEQALSGWATDGPRTRPVPLPVPEPGPALLLDRPGAVQTTVRLAAPVPGRTDPEYAALVLANLVFGGYFSSRLVANIREDKGYTYSPHSVVEHPPLGSRLVVSADVATAVTAPALMEMRYELGRVATVPVTQAELDQARRYAVGSLALSTSTQAGLASTLSLLTAAGLGVEWLREHPKALAAVTVDEALVAAGRYLAPTRMTTVLVGDAEQVTESVSRVVEVAAGQR